MMDRSTVLMCATTASLVATAYGALMPSISDVRLGQTPGSVLEPSFVHATLLATTAVVIVAVAADSLWAGIIGGAAVAGFGAAYRDAMDDGTI